MVFDFSLLGMAIFLAALSSDVWLGIGVWEPARETRRAVTS